MFCCESASGQHAKPKESWLGNLRRAATRRLQPPRHQHRPCHLRQGCLTIHLRPGQVSFHPCQIAFQIHLTCTDLDKLLWIGPASVYKVTSQDTGSSCGRAWDEVPVVMSSAEPLVACLSLRCSWRVCRASSRSTRNRQGLLEPGAQDASRRRQQACQRRQGCLP